MSATVDIARAQARRSGADRDHGLALLFPGQGAQSADMLAAFEHWPLFRERYAIVRDCLGFDVLEALRDDTQLIHRNAVSSLLTVLASTLSLQAFLAADRRPAFVAGYSVGQWSAMYAARMLDFESLVQIVARRASYMDECMTNEPGAMCAVIGIAEQPLASLLSELRQQGERIFISNYNCLGQYSIAGTVAAVERAESRLAALKPRKLLRLSVAGAWHSPMLQEAERKFLELLQEYELHVPEIPVIDNVTGDWLPTEAAPLRQHLARHISHSVRWETGMKRLIASGCSELVEIGHGNHLTKFGFFIDRQRTWRAFHH